MKKTVVITQSNYLPWRGYFDLLRSAHEVVLLDSVQYTRRDWRNRNRIKTPNGIQWLTISVRAKGSFSQSIDKMTIADPRWAAKHVRMIEMAYRRAPCFDVIAPWLFEQLRSVATEPLLTKVNEHLLRALCDRLGIKVPIVRDHELFDHETLRRMEPSERLIAILKALGSTRYLSGPAARDYLDLNRFAAENIEVAWMAYDDYPEYLQLWGTFEPRVSVVDLLLNTGDDAPRYLRRVAA